MINIIKDSLPKTDALPRHSVLTVCVVIMLLTGTAFIRSAYADGAQILGTGFGAAAGGIIGNQFGHGGGRVATTTAGVLVGGYIGNDIGRSIDNNDRFYNHSAYTNAYVSDPPLYYSTEYVPNYVAPPAPPPIYIDNQSGDYCREYSQHVRVGQQVQESYGTACLQPDGSWRAVE